MTIEKAIENLERILETLPLGEPYEERNAIKLGIEALKRQQKMRRFAKPKKVDLLPGETRD